MSEQAKCAHLFVEWTELEQLPDGEILSAWLCADCGEVEFVQFDGIVRDYESEEKLTRQEKVVELIKAYIENDEKLTDIYFFGDPPMPTDADEGRQLLGVRDRLLRKMKEALEESSGE